MASPPPIPQPAAGLLGGHLLLLRRDPPGFILNTARACGDVARLNVRFTDIYLVSHPDYVREVLVAQHAAFGRSWEYHVMKMLLGEGLLTAEGDVHRRQRKLVLPAFHHSRVSAYADTMAASAAAYSARWKEHAELDVTNEMSRLTLIIVGRTLFGIDLATDAPQINRALGTTLESYFRMLNPVRYLLRWLPIPSMVRFNRSRPVLESTVNTIIRQHRAHGQDRGDVVSMLLQARDEDDGSSMTDQQVKDQIMTILLAGHETTALALSWAWYLLAQHPDVEAKLHQEVDAVLGDRLPTAEDLQHLAYTRQVVTEAMRLYPPAWVIARKVLSGAQLGPYRLPAGSTVFVSAYAVHRSAAYYPEPDRFIPERWTPEFRQSLPKLAYFPFGSGPRVCIGEQFAWMEAVLVLATLAARWRLRLVPDHPVVPVSRLTLRAKYGIRLVPERRQPVSSSYGSAKANAKPAPEPHAYAGPTHL